MKGRRKSLIGYVGSNLPIRIGFRGNVGCKKKTFRFNIIYFTSHWVLEHHYWCLALHVGSLNF